MNPGPASRLRTRVTHRIGVVAAMVAAIWVLSLDGRAGVSAAPTPLAPDALLESQWHLKDRAQEVGGANVRAAWPTTLGAGIVIGIVDDGVQYWHPDLAPNYLAAASFDFNFNDADPQPYTTAAHGTAVAGVAAARGDNTIGVSGVAPMASLAALRLTAGAATDAQEAAAFGFQPNVIHILNNSWSPSSNGTTLKGPGTQATAARLSAATTGRLGKGRIFVQQSGDGRLNGDDCNFDGYANNRFVISVGALNDQGVQSSFSEGCSALMIVAPSGGGQRSITTTDLIGIPGYDGSDYTSTLSTTSAAAPAVSGAVALMLARNPNLTWRDVQHILRRTSIRILPTDVGWTTGTFRHNERLGFGLLDARASADMAAGWVNVPAEELLAPPTRTLNRAIPDINQTGISDSITISTADSNFVIEHVEVEFDATHTWRGDLQLKLTSPTGVVSMIAPIRPTDSGDNYPNWKFGSVRHWGDSPSGTWTLNVSDRRFADTGTWNSWTLRLYGHRTTATVPGTFTKSSPSNGAGGQTTSPTVSWTDSLGAAGYDYCYDTTNDSACTGWTGNGLNTSVGLSGLSAGVTYYWHVRAANAAGTVYANGSSTAFWSFTTGAPPAAFNKVSPAGGASGQSLTPTLTWASSAGASSYDYCYDTTNDNTCSAWAGAGLNTSVMLSGLAPGVAYFWQVRANSAAGVTYANGAAAAFWSFTTIAAPGAFSHSSPSNGATGQSLNPTLTWTASSGVVNYDYCYDTTNDNACGSWLGAGANTSVGLSGLTAGTTYYWHVRATNGGGTTYANGAASAFWSFTPAAPPGAFGKSTPANGATGQSLTPTVSWTSSAGATSYDYCYDTTNDNACSGWTDSGANTSAMVSGLTPGTVYFWQVRANGSGGTTYANGGLAAFWSFTTVALPGAFTHSSPSNGATGQSLTPTLSWTASSGVANYDYCYDTTNDNACGAWLGAGASTSVGLSGLTAGTTYYWQVRATNGGGTTYANGAASAFWSFTTAQVPAAFGKSTPANGATGQSLTPAVSWTSSAGATSYDYCYDTTNDNACSSWTDVGANTSAMLSGLTPGTVYFWQVRAEGTGGTTYANGALAAFWSFTTIAAPGAFSHGTPSNGATGQSLNPTLTWTASSGVANYDYCYDTTNDNACGAWLGAGASTSVGLSGLAAGTTYYWQVRATNGGGTTYANGAASAFWSFTTAQAPAAFAKSTPANGATGQSLTPTVSWTSSAGATSYDYCYDTTNDNACSSWTAVGANTSAMLSGLTPGTAYFWQVRAEGSGGTTYANGAASSFWSFTTVALPGAFVHSSPANGASGQSWSPTLTWTASTGAANYAYCIDTTDDNACSAWIGVGASTSVGLSAITPGATFYWQVRATNGGGTTYANGAATAYWAFTTRPRAKAIVDLDGDGNGDAFTYNPATGDWARQVSRPNGGFSTTLGSWDPGWTVVAANFNTDGLTDFFLFNPVNGQWFKMLNDGRGFTAQSSGSWWQGWRRYVLDLDGDGVSDFFLYDPESGQWFKAISTANGFTYSQGGWNPGWEIYPMTLDDDARGDMFLIDRANGRWFWVLSEEGPGFSYPLTETWFTGWQFYPGDFNGDGLTDVLLHDPATGTIFVASANAAGYTYSQGGWSLGWTPAVADLNADGKDDLFLHDTTTGVWFELISTGDGKFTNAGGQTWSLGWKLHFTDLNGDDRGDIILYDPVSGAWYQARNLTLGSFTYDNGMWQPGLTVVVRAPNR